MDKGNSNLADLFKVTLEAGREAMRHDLEQRLYSGDLLSRWFRPPPETQRQWVIRMSYIIRDKLAWPLQWLTNAIRGEKYVDPADVEYD